MSVSMEMSLLLHVLLPVSPPVCLPTCLTVRFGGWRSSWGVSTNRWRACRRLRTRYWGSPDLPPAVSQTRELLLLTSCCLPWPLTFSCCFSSSSCCCSVHDFNLLQMPNYTHHLSDTTLHTCLTPHYTPNYTTHPSDTKLHATPVWHTSRHLDSHQQGSVPESRFKELFRCFPREAALAQLHVASFRVWFSTLSCCRSSSCNHGNQRHYSEGNDTGAELTDQSSVNDSHRQQQTVQ